MGVPGAYIGQRGGPAAEWTLDNPVLREREAGWETDTGKVKLGDGVTAWVDLPYAADEIDENVIDGLIAAEVTSAVAGHTPGAEMGYEESGSGGSTTEVWTDLHLVTPLLMQVTGEGRPVDIEWYMPLFYHSVATTPVYGIMVTQIVGSGVNVFEQVVLHRSPVNDGSNPFYCKARKVLVDGTDYTVAFYVAGSAPGTTSYGASGGLQRMWAGVTSR